MMSKNLFSTAMPPAWREQWQQRTAPLRQQWLLMAPRERMAVKVAAAMLLFLLLWQVAVASAWRTVRTAPQQIDQLDAQLQHMQRLANEAKELRGLPVVSSAQAAQALTAATEHLGDVAKLSVQGDRATLTLSGASSEQLRSWLGEARSAAHARPIEAQLQRGPNGYTGTLVLSLGGI